jgi:hypothetical protein
VKPGIMLARATVTGVLFLIGHAVLLPLFNAPSTLAVYTALALVAGLIVGMATTLTSAVFDRHYTNFFNWIDRDWT